MKAFTNPADFATEVDEAKAHIILHAVFWPKRWKMFVPPPAISWKWKSVAFKKQNASQVPYHQHGLYTFVICPKVASHPQNAFILYVGKADNMSLRARFSSYFQEMKKIKRPAVCYYLNKYVGYIHFCFVPINPVSAIEPGEDALLAALFPPVNTAFPAEVRKIIRGIR